MSEPEKASVWGCSQQETQPASAVMGCHRNPCGIRFRFTIIGFLSVFYAQPQRPDWQIRCLSFLGLDYMLFLQSHLHLLTYLRF